MGVTFVGYSEGKRDVDRRKARQKREDDEEKRKEQTSRGAVLRTT